MIPSNFDYVKAGSVDEAIGLLQNTDAKLLAGGHSLLPAMKLRLSSPAKLIDISQIADLRFITDKGDHLSVGPATTHYDLESSELVQSKIPMLSEAAGSIGDLQVRNKGTIGGSIAHADPAADWPASLLATEAEIVVKGANGERSIAATDFFTGLFTTALQEDEIITEIKIPIPPANSGTSYQKFMQPASRFAIVGCAAVVTKNNGNCERVRVAFSGLGNNAFRATAVEDALTGTSGDEGSIGDAAAKAGEGVDPLSDYFASAEYRLHLAQVYARKALTEAISRV